MMSGLTPEHWKQNRLTSSRESVPLTPGTKVWPTHVTLLNSAATAAAVELLLIELFSGDDAVREPERQGNTEESETFAHTGLENATPYPFGIFDLYFDEL